MRFFNLTILLITGVIQPGWAGSLTLWGTNHPGMLGYRDPCAIQSDTLMNLIQQDNSLIQEHIPNLIFAGEVTPLEPREGRLYAIDDYTLHVYAQLFFNSQEFFSKIRNSVQIKISQSTSYEKAFHQFFGNLYWNITDPTIPKITKRLILKDRNEPYFQKLAGDFQRHKDLEDHRENIDYSKPPYQTGLTALILSYIQILSNPNIKVQMSEEDFEKGMNNLVSEINATLDAYAIFIQKVAQVYYNEKINSVSSREKYNITIDLPESEHNGKKIFPYVQPDQLFTSDNLLKGSGNELATVYWRDHFMAKNIIALMNQKPDADLLVWFGAAHMKGVTKLLALSNELTHEEKKSIPVITIYSNKDIACDYRKVLENITDPSNEIPNLSQWYATYGLKEKSYKLYVYSMEGGLVFKNEAFTQSIEQVAVEKYLKTELVSKGLNNQVFLVNIKTPKNIDAQVYKISTR